MSWFFTVIAGAIIGLIVGLIMRSSWHTGLYTNMFLGIIGAIVGVWFFSFVLGIGTQDVGFGSFQWVSLLWDLIGSVVVLYVLNLVSYAESAADQSQGEAPAYSAGTAHEYKKLRRP